MSRWALALFGLLMLFDMRGHAATIKAASDNGNALILVVGEIMGGDDERFATVAASEPDDVTVLLESPGGNLVAGLRIGSAIRMRAWTTVVADGSTCASACGLMWLGGVRRIVGRGAQVGFHAAWVEGPDGVKHEVGNGNALVGSYLGRLGLTDDAVVYLTSASPDRANWLTDTTARQVGIRAEFVQGEPPQRLTSNVPAIAPPARPAAPSPGTIMGANSEAQVALMQELYAGFPRSVMIPNNESCVGRPCTLRLLGDETWTGADGIERRTIVAAAEVEGDCHACAAILGVGRFRRLTPTNPWESETLTPAVTRIGGFGGFGGKVSFVDGGPLGRAIMVDDSGGGMGELDVSASFVVMTKRGFEQVLFVPVSLNVDRSCDEKEVECQKRMAESDYESKLALTVGAEGQLHIDQTFQAAIAIPPAHWTIDGNGTARQVAGGKSSAGSTATERALILPQSPAFQQGLADRTRIETWVHGLQSDARAGAESWAGRRSLRDPGNCDAPLGNPVDWSSGCISARQMLSPLDQRRRTEPEYRRGWNSL
jgi:hypothetical protein